MACDDLQWLSEAEAQSEGAGAERVSARCSRPPTGILDSHCFMHALLGEASEAGALVAYRTPFLSARDGREDQFMVSTGGGDGADAGQHVSALINASGLNCLEGPAQPDRGVSIPASSPKTRYAKGNYFALSAAARRSAYLIYPAPARARPRRAPDLRPRRVRRASDPTSSGSTRFGYEVDPRRRKVFAVSPSALSADLPDNALSSGLCGRASKTRWAQLTRPATSGLTARRSTAFPASSTCSEIESPGLTSSLAIAEEIVARLSA